jgi:hypothetical protein
MQVICPSGLTGEVRKLKGREANALADRRMARKGRTYDKILNGCWQSTDNPGPYKDLPSSGKLPWGKILVCDRFYTLAAIRIATYGSDYIFPTRCGDVGIGGCGNQFEWEVDIAKDLDVFDLPEESKAKIAAGDNRFEVTLEGVRYAFKLLTGEDERRTGQRLQNRRETLVTSALEARLLEVEGVEHKHEFGPYLEELDLDVQLELLDKFEEVDGGIDTDFEVECPQCEKVYKAPVPFEGEAFWLPRSQTRRKKKQLKRTPRRMGDS